MAQYSAWATESPPSDYDYDYGDSSNFESGLASSSGFVRTDVPSSVRTYYTNTQGAEFRFGSLSVDGPEVMGGSSTSPSNVIQPASPSINDRTPTQDDFDPEKFDPTNLSFKETYNILSECDLDKHVKFVRDTILKYSLSMRGFPPCPDEDLMIAVYFYFEEKFKIKAKFEFCARFDNHNQKNLVGVLLDSIQTKEEIFKKAAKRKCKKIKIMENGAFHWILNGYNGPYQSTVSPNSLQLKSKRA